MPEFAVQSLLDTPTVAIRDVYCHGGHRHQGAEECATATQLVFPYRGVYVRHLGRDQAVAEANQVLLFNAAESYRVSHPVPGGDASLTLVISEPLLRELAPPASLRDGAAPRISAAARADRCAGSSARGAAAAQPAREHRGTAGSREPRADPGAADAGATHDTQRRAPASDGSGWWIGSKLVLASDLARRWSLAEIAAEVRELPGLSHAGLPASGRAAVVSLPVATAARAGAGPSRAV